MNLAPFHSARQPEGAVGALMPHLQRLSRGLLDLVCRPHALNDTNPPNVAPLLKNEAPNRSAAIESPIASRAMRTVSKPTSPSKLGPRKCRTSVCSKTMSPPLPTCRTLYRSRLPSRNGDTRSGVNGHNSTGRPEASRTDFGVRVAEQALLVTAAFAELHRRHLGIRRVVQ